MSSAADSTLNLPTQSDGHLDCDFSCLRCRYNLRGLSADAQCPECGLDVRQSVELGQLHNADAGWLRSVADGATWAIVGLVGLLAYTVFALISDWHARYAGNPGLYDTWSLITSPCMAVGLLASAAGFWMITRPMPAQWCPPRLVRYRRLTRVTMLSALPLVPVCAWTPLLAQRWVIPVWIVSAVLLSAGIFFALRYAALLAAQVNHRTLLWQTRTIMAGFALCWAAAVLLVLWIEAAPAIRNLVSYPPVQTSARALIVTLLALAIWTMTVLWSYRRRYRAAATLAGEVRKDNATDSRSADQACQ